MLKMKLKWPKSLLALGILIIVASSSCAVIKQSHEQGYKEATLKADEALLRQNLKALREVIDQYGIDNGALPQTLEDFVKAGYVNQIPDDPITKKPDWKIVLGEKILRSTKQNGIIDVHSSSNSSSSEGTAYSTW